MANYFNFFPKVLYSQTDISNLRDIATNIISRYAFQQNLKQNTSVFYEYIVKDSDTPEIIAHKYYGDAERHWIILMFNDIFDTQYDWPLNYNNFINYVDSKYSANGAANTPSQSGLVWSMSNNNVHSYYKIISTSTNDGSVKDSITTQKIQVDANTYANVPSSSSISVTTANNEYVTITTSKEQLTYYDYENELNESKRIIHILKPDFVSVLEDELKRVLNAD